MISSWQLTRASRFIAESFVVYFEPFLEDKRLHHTEYQ